MQVLRERLEREGHIADEHDMEYFTADRLLKYLRARDHHEGRAAVAGGDGCNPCRSSAEVTAEVTPPPRTPSLVPILPSNRSKLSLQLDHDTNRSRPKVP